MKAIFCVMLLAFLVGCQHTTELNDPGKVESRLNPIIVEPHMNILAGSKMHSGQLTEQEQQDLAEEGRARMLELMKATTLPKLIEGQVLTLPLVEVEGKYAQFMSEQKNKSIVPLFRQQYARAIINDYKLLATDDYDKIKYYVNELLEGQSFDFRTISLGLIKLNGHADANYIKSSINRLVPVMEHRYQLEQVALTKIKEMGSDVKGVVSKKNPTDKDKETLLGLSRLRNKLEHSDTKECIRILSELNSGISNF